MSRTITFAALLFVFIAITAFVSGSPTEAKSKQEQPIPWVNPPSGIANCIDFRSGTSCGPFGDTDGDGFTDLLETELGSDPNDPQSTPEYGLYDEQTGLSTCQDGIDNDKDGRIDQSDSGCHVTCGDYAGHDQCADSDQDGFKNYVEVAYGSNPKDHSSTPETFSIAGTCGDGIDNDKDGLTDGADDGCGATCIDFSTNTVCLPF